MAEGVIEGGEGGRGGVEFLVAIEGGGAPPGILEACEGRFRRAPSRCSGQQSSLQYQGASAALAGALVISARTAA